jgi:hypothetical protein
VDVYFIKVPGLDLGAWVNLTTQEFIMTVLQRPALKEGKTLV